MNTCSWAPSARPEPDFEAGSHPRSRADVGAVPDATYRERVSSSSTAMPSSTWDLPECRSWQHCSNSSAGPSDTRHWMKNSAPCCARPHPTMQSERQRMESNVSYTLTSRRTFPASRCRANSRSCWNLPDPMQRRRNLSWMTPPFWNSGGRSHWTKAPEIFAYFEARLMPTWPFCWRLKLRPTVRRSAEPAPLARTGKQVK